MTKFENIGCELQYTAETATEANDRYEKSCWICSHHGMHIKCDKCAIHQVHCLVVAAFAGAKGGELNA